MSLIIKGEKMPKSCEYCLLSHYYPETERVWCNVSSRIIAENYDPFVNLKIEKPEWCPLEESEETNEIHSNI